MPSNNNKIFDSDHKIRHVTYEDIDRAFFDWWDKVLNIHLASKDNRYFKVPVIFVAQERWHLSREEDLRDEFGTLRLPIITITREQINSPAGGSFGRIYADAQQKFVYFSELNTKTSVLANLNAARPTNLDPNSPIYSLYVAPTPRHNEIVYAVDIWVGQMKEMNDILQKYELELNYNSVKSFQFQTLDKFYFNAFQEETSTNDGNLDDFSKEERKIKQTMTFRVPGWTLPENSERKNTFRRYFTQTKLVIKTETDLSSEDFKKL